MSEDRFNFYKHSAKYSDSQYHAVYHKNEYYLTYEKTLLTPKVKRALTLSWLINPHLFYILSDTIVLGEEQNNVSDKISCGYISVILHLNGSNKS